MTTNRWAILLVAALAQTAFAQPAAKNVEVNGVVSMEAENYTAQTGYARVASSETSGGAGMRAVGAEGSNLDFKFSVQQAGTWYFWVRANATADVNNGFRLALDGSVRGDVYLKKIGWSWTPEWLTGHSHAGPITLNLTAGTHTLSILKRKVENPLLDKIVLTRSATAPTGLGPATTGTGTVSTLAISPASLSLTPAAANGRKITVTANTAWTATANKTWISIVSGTAGTGNGTVTFNVAANVGAARSGTLTVTGGGVSRVLTINQSAAALSLAPENIYVASGGANGRQLAITANFPWTATINDPWIEITSFMSGSGTAKVTFDVEPNPAPRARKGSISIAGGGIVQTFTVYQWPASTHPLVSADGDFDGDFEADVATFQPATGKWDALLTAGNRWIMPFGSEAMLPVPADYDGDGVVDFALFQPDTGDWYMLFSAGGSRKVRFGWSKTVPLPGDYDGDGRADWALYYPEQARWYFLCTAAGGSSVQFGGPADIPVPADYDGDGALDMAVYRPANGTWYIVYSGGGSRIARFGGASMIPVPGDYDGDGLADVAVLHRETATWNILYSGGGSLSRQYGYKTMTPVAADYDGDGATDIAMYHPASGTWFIRESTTLTTRKVVHGGPDRIPVLLNSTILSWFGML
ncbi:MAG: BACON domain-containing carbohydrate-binding protein [Kiritimatiellia bacterium]